MQRNGAHAVIEGERWKPSWWCWSNPDVLVNDAPQVMQRWGPWVCMYGDHRCSVRLVSVAKGREQQVNIVERKSDSLNEKVLTAEEGGQKEDSSGC